MSHSLNKLSTTLPSAVQMRGPSSTFSATPEMILGPFYPTNCAPSISNDLTNQRGQTTRGQHIHLTGRVLNKSLHPVNGARIEIWQANSVGRYRHPGDRSPEPLDPAFDGFAAQTTGAEGTYKFRTVLPGPYLTPLRDMRAPHIHFQVTVGAFRLVTQMFFPAEPLNESDRFLRASLRREMLVALRVQDPSMRPLPSFTWDINLHCQ